MVLKLAISDNLGGMLLFSLTFLGLFALLGGSIPTNFYVDFEEPELYVPESGYWTSVDLNFYAYYQAYTLNETGGYVGFPSSWYIYDFTLGSQELSFVYRRPGESDLKCGLQHYSYHLWIFGSWHYLDTCLNTIGDQRLDEYDYLTDDYIQADFSNDRLPYKWSCEHNNVRVWFNYNTTLYSDVTDAWNNSDLHVLFALGMDQATSSMNAWDLIGMVLFFSIPDTHPLINAVIGIPIWIIIVYCAVRLILLALPFVG